MKWQLQTILFIMFSLLFKNIAGVPKPFTACSSAHDMFVSEVFLKAQKDILRGLIKVCKVTY